MVLTLRDAFIQRFHCIFGVGCYLNICEIFLYICVTIWLIDIKKWPVSMLHRIYSFLKVQIENINRDFFFKSADIEGLMVIRGNGKFHCLLYGVTLKFIYKQETACDFFNRPVLRGCCCRGVLLLRGVTLPKLYF